MKGNLFAIKRYALHDGPNIRTTVFLKGCPLECRWCHNPEGLELSPKVIWSAEKCIGCGECLAHCPEAALNPAEAGITKNLELCNDCGQCVPVCPALAHEATGWTATVEEVMEEIEKDRPFFDQSGGGVTFSGGEPLMQHAFLLALLEAAGRIGIHRVVDTSGYAPPEILQEIADHTELFLFDLKLMDNKRHKEQTGVENTQILKNIRLLADSGHDLQVRIPLIPGINDDQENIRATGSFVASLPGIKRIDLLPYHHSATAKYRKLHTPYALSDFAPPPQSKVDEAADILKQFGLSVHIGG